MFSKLLVDTVGEIRCVYIYVNVVGIVYVAFDWTTRLEIVSDSKKIRLKITINICDFKEGLIVVVIQTRF